MAGTPTLLVSSIQLTEALEDAYFTPAGSSTTISAFSLNNTSGRAADVWIHVVRSGWTADATNQLATNLRVEPNSPPLQVPSLVGQVLPAGCALKMRSSIGNAVTPLVSGIVAEA
jgi:hypothetical protein